MLKWINDKLRGWRTLIVNGLMAVMPILELTEFRDVLPQDWLKWYALGVVLANMYLRYITTTAVGRKQ